MMATMEPISETPTGAPGDPVSSPDRRDPHGGSGHGGRGRPSTPRILEPFFVRYERLNRRRLRIRQVRRGGIMGVVFRRYRGPAVNLRDGTVVRPGDLIGEMHLDNERLRAALRVGTEAEAWRIVRDDFRALAAWASRVAPERRPVAYGGESILAPMARRVGFEIYPLPSTAWTRLQDWYLRGVMARWSVEGRSRLREGRGRLRAAAAWMSHATLLRRHGS